MRFWSRGFKLISNQISWEDLLMIIQNRCVNKPLLDLRWPRLMSPYGVTRLYMAHYIMKNPITILHIARHMRSSHDIYFEHDFILVWNMPKQLINLPKILFLTICRAEERILLEWPCNRSVSNQHNCNIDGKIWNNGEGRSTNFCKWHTPWLVS